MRPIARPIACAALLAIGTQAAVFGGQTPESEHPSIQELRDEIRNLQEEYQRRITQLEERLLQVESAQNPSTPVPLAAPAGRGPRTLQALNPEISVTGDVTARASDDTENDQFNRFNFDGLEVSIQHPLDPFSTAKFFVAVEDGEFELEEGYINWASLPGSLGLKVGRFHNNFGKFNRFHKHALPWADRDLPTRTLFGDEGLTGTGIALEWMAPRLPWSQVNELSFEITNNTNDLAFSGRGFGDPVFTARLLNYYDLSDDAYLEWGLSGSTSHWDLERQHRSTVLGLDLSYRWEPLRRAAYRSLTLQTELLFNDRREWPGGDVFGMYASAEYQLARNWYGGLRYQIADSLEDPEEQEWALSPFLTFWQSEWVRLRTQYDFLRRSFQGNEHRFFVQFTWSVGPHKHEAY